MKHRESSRSGVASRCQLQAVFLSRDPYMIRHFTGMVQTAMAIVSGTFQGARGTHMCVRPPQRRYLCLGPGGDSCRRSRFLKKRPDRHWLAEGRLELRSQPIELRTLVRSWLCSPTSTGALYVRAWTVSPTIQRHNDMHREHTLLRCARFQACNPAREIFVPPV